MTGRGRSDICCPVTEEDCLLDCNDVDLCTEREIGYREIEEFEMGQLAAWDDEEAAQ